MTADINEANQIAESTQFAIDDNRRRVSNEMQRPNPAPEPSPLPEHLMHVGPLDSDTMRRHRRQQRRRAIPPRPAEAGVA